MSKATPTRSVVNTLPPIGRPKLELGVWVQLLMIKTLAAIGLFTVERMARRPLATRRAPPPSWTTRPPLKEAAISERDIPGRGGQLKLRLYMPPATDPTKPMLLFLHGGGFIFGSPPVCDYLCSRIAVDARMAVASLQYRLAPEFPFPAAVEDACDAAEWLAKNGSAIAASSGVAMMGESAGASLTASACLELTKQGRSCVIHQTLLYPLLDCTLQSPSMAYRGGLTREQVTEMLKLYLKGADPRDPRASPLLAPDLSGLPETLIVTADADSLRDDGHRYAKRLSAAGVPVRFINVTDAIHGFFASPRWSKAAHAAIDLVVEEMRLLGAEMSKESNRILLR